MKQTNSATALKRGIFIFIGALIVFVLSQLLASWILMKIPHFESYYPLATAFGILATALFIATLSKSSGQNPYLVSALSSLALSLLFVAFGLIFGGENFRLTTVLLHHLALFLLSLGLTFLTLLLAARKKRGSRKFRFSK